MGQFKTYLVTYFNISLLKIDCTKSIVRTHVNDGRFVAASELEDFDIYVVRNKEYIHIFFSSNG